MQEEKQPEQLDEEITEDTQLDEGPGKPCPPGQTYDTYLKRCVNDPI